MSAPKEHSTNQRDDHLGFALIGCGDIGRLRAAALAKANGCQLMAVSDLDQPRMAELSREYGCEMESDWHALLGREDIAAVMVSTPPSVHAEMAIEALKAGKHVLCEKPLARSLGECRAMVEAASRSSRVLGAGFNYRFYPSVRKARELIDAGAIGDIDHIRSYAGYSAEDHSHPWLRDVTVMGGGAFRDNGIHLIDLTRYFLGDVETVTGFVSNRFWRFDGCEDNGFALLRSRGGAVASLHASWTEFKGYRFEIEIYGTRGYIRTRCFPMITEVASADLPGKRLRRKRYLFPLVHLLEHLRSYRWVVTRSFVHELDAFRRAVHGEQTELALGPDGLAAVEIAEAAAKRTAMIERLR